MHCGLVSPSAVLVPAIALLFLALSVLRLAQSKSCPLDVLVFGMSICISLFRGKKHDPSCNRSPSLRRPAGTAVETSRTSSDSYDLGGSRVAAAGRPLVLSRFSFGPLSLRFSVEGVDIHSL